MPPPPFYELDGQIAIDLPGGRAVFTTRSWGDVRLTQAEIAQRLGVEIVGARQVHGSAVVDVAAVRPTTEADALISAAPGVAALVRAADCVPVVISAPGVVGVVHAGWRGLKAGVIARAVAAMRAATVGSASGSGSSHGADSDALAAAIGPGAGACCYEVGADLLEQFAGFCAGPNLDLKAVARSQLAELGVGHVHDTGVCTICSDPSLHFSYRRDGAGTGRQAAIAWLT